MKKRSTLMALMLVLFTVILGLNSVHAAATTKTIISDKIWWNNVSYNRKFEDFENFKYIGDVARNDHGIFYWTESGDLAWYNPKTGNTIAAILKMSGPGPRLDGSVLEGGDIQYAQFVAGQNYLKGYTTLDKIKAAMQQNQLNQKHLRIDLIRHHLCIQLNQKHHNQLQNKVGFKIMDIGTTMTNKVVKNLVGYK